MSTRTDDPRYTSHSTRLGAFFGPQDEAIAPPEPLSAAEAELMQRYSSLVTNLVDRLLLDLPFDVDRNRVYKSGLDGLCEAIRLRHQFAGDDWESFVRSKIRIAVFNHLREAQWTETPSDRTLDKSEDYFELDLIRRLFPLNPFVSHQEA